MTFGEYLNECVENRGIPVAKITRISGINRGKLYNVFYDKRRLTEEELFALIENAGFSPTESDKLCDLYFSEVYGKNEFERIKYLENALRHEHLEGSSSTFSVNHDTIGNSIENTKQLIDTVSFMFFNEKKIISNFPFSAKSLDDIVFYLTKNGKSELVHIMEIPENEVGSKNIEAFFAALKYMYAGSFPVYRYIHSSGNSTNLYPYYFVGEKSAVLFNKNSGIILKDKSSVDGVRKAAEEKVSECTALGSVPDDIFQIAAACGQQFSEKKSFYSFSYYPCIAKYTDYDILFSMVRDDIPNRKVLTDFAFNHYKVLYSNINVCCFVTVNGLEEFSRTGHVQEAPYTFITDMSVENRIKVLYGMLDGIENGELYIVDDAKLHIVPGFMIESSPNKVITTGYDKENENFFGVEAFHSTIPNATFANTLENLADFLIRSKKVFAKEYSQKLIHSLIAKTMNYGDTK